jgi:heat shock protein HslJ
MHHERTRLGFCVLAALLLVSEGIRPQSIPPAPIGAATDSASPPGTRGGGPTAKRLPGLEQDTWELGRYRTAIGLKEVVSDSGPAYAQFSDGRFRINAGCDTLRGSYLLEGDRLLFSVHVTAPIGDCPSVLAEQEQALIDLLPRITRVSRIEATATDAPGYRLLGARGETLLTLSAPSSLPLQGRRWRLVSYRGADALVRPALAEPVFTLWFEDALNLAGQACDRYNASFIREDRFLRLQGPVATSRFGCEESAAARAQGDAYLDALALTEAYRVDGDTLLLRDRDGRMLARFKPAVPPLNAEDNSARRGIEQPRGTD